LAVSPCSFLVNAYRKLNASVVASAPAPRKTAFSGKCALRPNWRLQLGNSSLAGQAGAEHLVFSN
jgi:hypothetical protein